MTHAQSIMTTREAARFLRLSLGALRGLVNARVIPCVRLNGRTWRFRRASLERWVETRER
jgi:excisionase family DNA binding protein